MHFPKCFHSIPTVFHSIIIVFPSCFHRISIVFPSYVHRIFILFHYYYTPLRSYRHINVLLVRASTLPHAFTHVTDAVGQRAIPATHPHMHTYHHFIDHPIAYLRIIVISTKLPPYDSNIASLPSYVVVEWVEGLIHA